jgi:hypothetical protein
VYSGLSEVLLMSNILFNISLKSNIKWSLSSDNDGTDKTAVKCY